MREDKAAIPAGDRRDTRDLARQHTEVALRTLVDIAKHGASESARVAAASALLDRGWGRPTQQIGGDPTGAPIIVIPASREPAIDATPEVRPHGKRSDAGSRLALITPIIC